MVALLGTGMIDLAVTGKSRSKIITYLSNVFKVPQSDDIRQNLAASDEWLYVLLVMSIKLGTKVAGVITCPFA